jgi:hypothetical protein
MIEDLTQGLEGELGYKGERGYSAYEIAVQNGYEGTEQEWIDHFGLDLTNYVQTSDVVDNLTSDVTNYPLSAKQGKALKTLVDDLDTSKADANTTYSKTEVDTMLATKVPIDNIYVFSGEKLITHNGGTNIRCDFPEGFTKDNSFVISAMTSQILPDNDNVALVGGLDIGQVYGTGGEHFYTGFVWTLDHNAIEIRYPKGNDNYFYIYISNPTSSTDLTVKYKVVIMKIDNA